MPEAFAQPAAGLATGISQGFQMSLQAGQLSQQRQQQKRENDFNMLQKGIEIANLKGVSPETRANVLNNTVAPLWNQYNPKNPFPTITGKNVDQYGGVIKNSFDLLKQARDGKVTHQFAFDEAHKQWAEAVNNHSEAETEQEKAARETSIAAVDKGFEESTKGTKAQMSPQDAAKRVTELTQGIAKFDQADKVTIELAAQHPELAGAIGKPITPELKQQFISAVSNEIKTLNPLLPTPYKPITRDEYGQLIKAGHTPSDIFGSNLYLAE
jgi:hypothetical protein